MSSIGAELFSAAGRRRVATCQKKQKTIKMDKMEPPRAFGADSVSVNIPFIPRAFLRPTTITIHLFTPATAPTAGGGKKEEDAPPKHILSTDRKRAPQPQPFLGVSSEFSSNKAVLLPRGIIFYAVYVAFRRSVLRSTVIST